jgi:hypothetical protein
MNGERIIPGAPQAIIESSEHPDFLVETLPQGLDRNR